ncbi:serine/threonine-protein kinase [Streptomyces sp. XM4193]|uniref:serine/threonine-protein kinase n=1 Tax=Streptomyces sp. XM4193 TaxID=2929782 RepID=UPI001FF703E7|nr:serine/threonine-protein kinase [Streptomyces sp. XM4193]MCK1796219.1 serine/threonine-protein kinase [Streptomyces sp. XM4193]
MEPLSPDDPTRIGPYTLLGRLGAGGMGSVHLGRSSGGRTVAVKLIRPELADDEGFRARFRAEVSAARAVSGAFTAPVVAADPDAEVPWMATAFVPGVSLHRAVTDHGPLPESALRSLLAGIAEALVNIHAAGLTHRDLKPANVLLALDGPHVIDFGIARAADGTALTAAGTVLGTPSYMSPEQARAGEVTTAADVFSLGATLAFAARGHGLFGSPGEPPLRVLRRVAEEEPDLAAVPPSLRLTVAACLAKSPQDRPTPGQLVEFVQQLAVRIEPGSWLPPAIVAAVEEAADVMAPRATDASASAGAGGDAGGAGSPAGGAGGPYGVGGAGGPYGAGPAGAHGPSAPGVVPPPPSHPPASPPDSGRPSPSRRALVLGLAAGAVALVGGGGAAVALWPRGEEPNGPSGKGGSSSKANLADPGRSLSTETEAKPRWSVTVSGNLTEIGGAGETVVVGAGKQILAFSREGRALWGPNPLAAELNTGGMGGNAFAVDDKHVYALVTAPSDSTSGLPSRALRAVRLETGETVWTAKGKTSSVSMAWVPGVLGDTVYVRGDTAPKIELPDDISDFPTDPSDLASGFPSGPAGGRSTFVWAVNTGTGKVGWERSFKNTMMNQTSLRIPSTGRRLFWLADADMQGTAPRMSALDADREGRQLWEQPAPGGGHMAGTGPEVFMQSWFDGPHTSAGGHFLYPSNKLYAVDPENGQVAWSSTERIVYYAVCANADGSTVFAAGPDHQGKVLVHAFDARTGDVRWAGHVPTLTTGSVAIRCADDTAYLWTNGRVWALDEEDGRARWHFDFRAGTSPLSEPVAMWAGGGLLYGPGEDGLTAVTTRGS